MIPKRLFVITLAVSLALHILFIALTGFSGFPTVMPGEGGVFRVSLEKSPSVPGDETIGNEAAASADEPPPPAPPESPPGGGQREDTVRLDSTDPRYHTYLSRIKERIESHWSYPFKSYLLKEEGTAVMTFAVTGDGSLIDPHILESSGYTALDAESIYAVTSSAPLPSLPENLNLSKLHIIAAFTYRISE